GFRVSRSTLAAAGGAPVVRDRGADIDSSNSRLAMRAKAPNSGAPMVPMRAISEALQAMVMRARPGIRTPCVRRRAASRRARVYTSDMLSRSARQCLRYERQGPTPADKSLVRVRHEAVRRLDWRGDGAS